LFVVLFREPVVVAVLYGRLEVVMGFLRRKRVVLTRGDIRTINAFQILAAGVWGLGLISKTTFTCHGCAHVVVETVDGRTLEFVLRSIEFYEFVEAVKSELGLEVNYEF
ncbi:hypothetical protein, partial [Thermogladius sp.]|uniref:hypothetical protein n=1 Tax=Thermogladius sp. TaxID=2023064 RepID=UPI003D11A362